MKWINGRLSDGWCYLSLADDEEGVSSGSLSDDVLPVVIMSLNRQK